MVLALKKIQGMYQAWKRLLKEERELILCSSNAGHEAADLNCNKGWFKLNIKKNLCSKNSGMLELAGKGSSILVLRAGTANAHQAQLR